MREVNLNRNGRRVRMCPYCISCVLDDHFETHYNICHTFKGISNIRMPDEGSVYKFRLLEAIEKNMFSAYFDTETLIKPMSDGKRTHEFIAYSYIIIDKHGKVRAFKEEVVKKGDAYDDLPKSFINNLMSDYKSLFIEWEKTWNQKPILTKENYEKFRKTNACELCGKVFNGTDKHKHHSWDAKVEYQGKKIIKDNYQCALCRACNTSLTLKKNL